MKHLCGLLLFLCVVSGLKGSAQDFKAAYPGTGTAALAGDWRFHTSDDMNWAKPGLDDSAWETITADAPWGAQTHPGHTGFAWYRRAIEIDGVKGPLSLWMPPVADAYEVYWNGEKIGGNGTMPPHADWKSFPTPHVFALPEPNAPATLKGELAIRVWKAPLSTLEGTDGGGLRAPPKIGDSKVLGEELRLAFASSQERHLLTILECALMLAIGLFALGTWARDRRNIVFLWLGLFLCAAAGYGAFGFSAFAIHVTLAWFQAYVAAVSMIANLAIWAMVMTLFGLVEERRWRVLTAWMATVFVVSQTTDVWTQFVWGNAGPGIQTVDWVSTIIFSVVPLYEFVLLVAGLRRRRDWDLIPMVVACSALDIFLIANGALSQGNRYTHIDFQAFINRLTLHVGPYTLSVRDQITSVLLVVLVWTVLRQQSKERRQQLALEAEIKSAREVQQVLVPEAMEPVVGYAISSLYWPAEEVGGDLFQVLPDNDGGALVVLADVSGKGLKAAMTVSVMVGAIRTLAEYTMEPEEILQGLNRRLMGRTDGGFATCVVLHVKANGEVEMGNAGHLAPFLNGEEMAMPGSLPLGIAHEAEFERSRFVLNEDDEVTLYTDGVLEAQAKSGELYGFERTKALMKSKPSVQAIAEAAKSFGQKDDVTLVKIARVHEADARPRISVDLQTVKMTGREVAV